LRVIFVITGACATAGGIAVENRHVLRVLTDLLNTRRDELTIFSFLEATSDRPLFLPRSVTFRGFTGNKVQLSLALLWQSIRRPRFVFDHVTLAKPLLPVIALRLVRVVIFAHGSESWKRLRPINRWLFSHATLVLTNSCFTLNKMRERIPRFNGVACPLGLAPEIELNQKPPESPAEALTLENANGDKQELGARVCLLVGRMHPSEREKGHYALLAIWPEVVREFPDAQLVFAGPGEDRDNIARVASEAGISDAVFVLAPLPQEILVQLYAQCYAFTMPSRQEGFGLVYLEAMNFAKPCLGFRDDGAEDVIVHGETGLLIGNPKDKAELVDAVRRLLRDPDEAREMGRRGFARLHAQFTAAHVQQRIRQQLEKVI
jgi:phosphatidylinositol alpha-1,6-mannosyltransferase